ncbi:response regulator [Imperialibacter roseus]|uniref:Response regulator n=1 Tax=Imperialibacter roseus TaxID=1324217 RepID=A0ABZ0IKS7_9BACT|nr:response regulator [Imperialibacter roseus]WOK05627.1 response regulator [Imperialibacter roseus]
MEELELNNTPKVSLVMLVDDNDTDNFLSKKIMEHVNFSENILIKNTGKSALEYLHQNQNDLDKIPDIIFLDINMPIVDGFVFLYEYENFPPQLHEKVKVVVLSSSNNKRDINQFLNNRFVHQFISKPLSEKALMELAATEA